MIHPLHVLRLYALYSSLGNNRTKNGRLRARKGRCRRSYDVERGRTFMPCVDGVRIKLWRTYLALRCSRAEYPNTQLLFDISENKHISSIEAQQKAYV